MTTKTTTTKKTTKPPVAKAKPSKALVAAAGGAKAHKLLAAQAAPAKPAKPAKVAAPAPAPVPVPEKIPPFAVTKQGRQWAVVRVATAEIIEGGFFKHAQAVAAALRWEREVTAAAAVEAVNPAPAPVAFDLVEPGTQPNTRKALSASEFLQYGHAVPMNKPVPTPKAAPVPPTPAILPPAKQFEVRKNGRAFEIVRLDTRAVVEGGFMSRGMASAALLRWEKKAALVEVLGPAAASEAQRTNERLAADALRNPKRIAKALTVPAATKTKATKAAPAPKGEAPNGGRCPNCGRQQPDGRDRACRSAAKCAARKASAA